MIKLLMGWDIRPNKESEYFEFVMKEFAPAIMELGLQPTEAWYTMYGGGPQILIGGVTEDLDTMVEILESSEWKDIYQQLLSYVHHYRHKVVRATGRLQLLPRNDEREE
jgi:hypothetical protein